MKKKLVAVFAIVAVFGLAIAAYAYTQTTFNTTASASCCKDNCPMKNKGAEHGKDHAKGEAHECCGDSCPIKKKEGRATTMAVSASEEGKDCCDNCDCCMGKDKAKTASM